MKSIKYSFPILFLIMTMLATSLATSVMASTTVITVTTAAVYHPGQTVVVEGTAPPNVKVGMSVYNPNNVLVYSTIVNSTSSGTYQAVLFTFPSAATSECPYGTYTVDVGTSTGFTNSTTFEFEPLQSLITVEVFNPSNVAVQGANVYVNSTLVGTTNSSGELSFYEPSGTYDIMVVPPSPYVPESKVVTVVAPTPVTEKFVVQQEQLTMAITKVLAYNSSDYMIVDLTNVNIQTTPIYVVGNSTLWIYVNTFFEGKPVTNATVSLLVDGMTYSGVYNTSVGAYVVKVPIPNVPLEESYQIEAMYSGYTSNETGTLIMQYNQAYIIGSIEAQVSELQKE
ncbi:alpha-2-macroglobulin, partial [Acidianus sp. RZ1]|uniref:alpha-2-macroglobulin n=1 Tax=Acidianus sp. RZ1 TaxID=1540082 RepID=UPI0014931D5C